MYTETTQSAINTYGKEACEAAWMMMAVGNDISAMDSALISAGQEIMKAKWDEVRETA